ncbi:hypothetical protein M758_1G225600 [Ceratodon purpureus]|nr:hypothetical protein M758_1G225600 [Ceratodon purpureus]
MGRSGQSWTCTTGFSRPTMVAMETRRPRWRRFSSGGSRCTFRAMAVLMIFSFCIFSQVCVAERQRGEGFPSRRLLQGDPSVGEAPPVGYAISHQIVVDANGLGDFTTVQGAVDAVPAGNPQKIVIRINAGDYVEKVKVPSTLPFLTFQGAGASSTSISWNSIAGDTGPDGKALGSYNSASVMVFAPNFVARDIAFKNTAEVPPPGATGRQGAAFRIAGDKAAFYNCEFYGGQDTLCDDTGRHYFKNCYIQGSIDFVFGNGQSMYMASTLHSIATSTGSIAAQERESPDDTSGFAFVGCQIIGSGSNYLGRAMGKYSRIIYSECYIENIIQPQVWDADWTHDGSNRQETVTYGMYECWGPGAATIGQPWARTLNQVEAMPFTHLDFISGQEWLPEI